MTTKRQGDEGELNLQPSCSVCLRPFTTTAAGVVRQHGPVKSRCPGSHRPPRTSCAPGQLPSKSNNQGAEDATAVTPPSDPHLEKVSVRVLKRLPKVSRECAVRKLAGILEAVVRDNDYTLWVRLHRFTTRCLRHPGKEGRGSSLATVVNRQLREETDLQDNSKLISKRVYSSTDPEYCPTLHPFVHSAYSSPSSFFGWTEPYNW